MDEFLTSRRSFFVGIGAVSLVYAVPTALAKEPEAQLAAPTPAPKIITPDGLNWTQHANGWFRIWRTQKFHGKEYTTALSVKPPVQDDNTIRLPDISYAYSIDDNQSQVYVSSAVKQEIDVYGAQITELFPVRYIATNMQKPQKPQKPKHDWKQRDARYRGGRHG